MKRSMMQVYLDDAKAAIALYQEAFGVKKSEFYEENGLVMHSELDIEGHVLAVCDDRGAPRVTGNTMQFCLHYEEGREASLRHAYETLLPGATVREPLGPCTFSPLMTDIIDIHGVRWCLFI